MLLAIDWSFVATVVGTIATVVFGVWGVLLYKKRVYPGELTYFREPAIRLFADITGNLPLLGVTYNGQPVAKNLSLLKGFLMNTGGKDITSDMVVKPLQMGLAEGYRWIEASAKSSSNPEANVKIIDPKTVEFSLGFFRCGEFLRFEGIIEVEEGKQWAGAVWLDHRIADTSAVKYEKVPEKPEQHWRMFGQLLTPISFIVVMFVSDLKRQQPTPMLFTTAIMAGAMCLIIGLPLATNRKAKKRRKILMLN